MKTDIFPLCNIIMPKKSICPKTEMYFRADSSVKYCEADSLLKFEKSGAASFDTYFNTFALGKYRKYCDFSELYLNLKFCGIFVLRIFSVTKNDSGFNEECILEKEIHLSDASEKTVSVPLNEKTDGSQIYFTLSARCKGVFYGASYGCRLNTFNNVNIAVVICTYKREKYLLKNLEAIKKSSLFHENKIHCYVVDNGKTLSPDEVEREHISLFPNKNTGGSGGFTRGYKEAVKSGRAHTHILFADDDIVLDCEALFRVYSLLSAAKGEYNDLAVGGAMLKLKNPVIQHEAGAIWDGKRIVNIGGGMDMTVRENVFDIMYLPKPNYNAWWFYCFPACWYKKYGFPLPFFIKTDDIEYSVRCASEIAVINGIAVWHEDFENKYNGCIEYYIKRNELIHTSVSNQRPYMMFQIRKLIFGTARQIVFQRYFLADLIIRAYEDYLLGYENFINTDSERLNRELSAYCPELLNDDELMKRYGVYFDEEKYNISMNEKNNIKVQAPTLNGYLIPTIFYPKDKDGFAVVDLAGCQYINFFRHKRVLHYDTENKRGYVTEQKRAKLIKYGFKLAAVSFKFAVKYRRVRLDYKRGVMFGNKPL